MHWNSSCSNIEAMSSESDQSWGSPLIFPPIRVRVNHHIGTALVPMSRQFSLIRVGVNVFSFHRSESKLTTILEHLLFQYLGNFSNIEAMSTHQGWGHLSFFHRSELGLTTILEQLLFQYRGNFHSSELGFTSYLFTDQS